MPSAAMSAAVSADFTAGALQVRELRYRPVTACVAEYELHVFAFSQAAFAGYRADRESVPDSRPRPPRPFSVSRSARMRLGHRGYSFRSSREEVPVPDGGSALAIRRWGGRWRVFRRCSCVGAGDGDGALASGGSCRCWTPCSGVAEARSVGTCDLRRPFVILVFDVRVFSENLRSVLASGLRAGRLSSRMIDPVLHLG